jgi:hypothetical protein
MFRLPLIGFTACTQHIGHPRSTSKPFLAAVQPARRVLLMFLRNIPSPYSLSAQRFQQARLLLRPMSACPEFLPHAKWYPMRDGDYLSVFRAFGNARPRPATP